MRTSGLGKQPSLHELKGRALPIGRNHDWIDSPLAWV